MNTGSGARAVALALAALALAAATSSFPENSHLVCVRPGRMRGLGLARTGTDAVRRGDIATGLPQLEAAVREDPLLVKAWINLAAAQIQSCQKENALFSALLARILDPGNGDAAENLKAARQLQCPGPAEETDPARRAEWQAFASQETAAAWLSAAAARRGRRDNALAILYEEIALERGAERAPSLHRIVGDLEALGLLRVAAGALEATGDAADAAAARTLRERVGKLAADAARVGGAVAPRAGLRQPEEVDGAAQLVETFMVLGADAARAGRQLEDLLGVGAAQKVSGWWGEVTLADDWTSVRVPEDAGAADLVLRRFPWDTQLAFYAWSPPSGGADPGATLVRRLADHGAVLAGPFARCETPPGEASCVVAPLDLDLGFEGRGRVTAHLVGPRDRPPVLLILGLAGAAGCGAPCQKAAQRSIDDLVGTLHVSSSATVPNATPVESLRVPVPPAWQGDRPHREDEDPWRKTLLGDGIAVDLPPGISAGAVMGFFASRQAGPLTRQVLRGRFVDLDGHEVGIGDSEWAGWIDVAPGRGGDVALAREKGSGLAPRMDPEAKFVRQADLGPALALAGGPAEGVIARFEGRRFQGVWLVMWLRLDADLVEIALPVSAGARSASLPWIAVTVRREGDEPPPPPADLSERYKVHFTRSDERESRTNPTEGTLELADLQLSVPKSYRVSLSPASRDGFPVTLRGAEGGTVVIDRLVPAQAGDLAARRGQTEAREGPPAKVWTEPRRLRNASQSEAEFAARQDGRRERVVILVAPDDFAALPAYRITVTRGRDVADDVWKSTRRLVSQSLRYRPPATHR